MPIASILMSLFTSSVGHLLLVAVVAFGIGHHRASVACKQRADVERAQWLKAQTAEIARQAKAAQDIALHDRARAEEATARADEMQKIIDDVKQKKGGSRETAIQNPRVASCPDFHERDFAERVRRLDAAAAGRKR